MTKTTVAFRIEPALHTGGACASRHRLRHLMDELQLLGFDMVEAGDGDATPAADCLLLHLTGHDAERRLHALQRPTAVPALWLAEDEQAERVALAAAEPADQVARVPAQVETLRLQVLRLLALRGRDPATQSRDGLTGLLNRRAFGLVLRQALEDIAPGDHRAVVLFDLDHFKTHNDQHGHAVGDQLLRAVAERLSAGLGPDDQVARLGGDEFAVLLSRYDAPSLVREAETMLRRIAQPVPLPGRELVVQASAGLATLRAGLTETQLLSRADFAVFEAKASGRGRLLHFELIHDGSEPGPEADLQRFTEVTRMFSERMTRMVGDMGRQLVEAVRLQALRDPLTGVRNRGFFKERLPRDIERARASGRPLALALLDIDDFHDVNVRYGWPSGDAVLQRFVALAEKSIRVIDWIARYGGEEFAIVLPDTDLDLACSVLERLRQEVESAEFLALDGRRIPITLSIGVAALTPALRDAVSLANEASEACLAAKAAGKNRVVRRSDDASGPAPITDCPPQPGR